MRAHIICTAAISGQVTQPIDRAFCASVSAALTRQVAA